MICMYVVWVMCYGHGYDDDYCLIDGVSWIPFLFFRYYSLLLCL